MNKKIAIIGAGGQAKNISFLIEQIGEWDIVGFIDKDNSTKGEKIRGYPILGDINTALEVYEEINIALALGNPLIIEKNILELKSLDKKITFPNLIHPSAIIEQENTTLGEGNVINAGCAFTTETKIGNFNYFNRMTGTSHDTTIGDYCLFHTGAVVSGGSKIGNKVQIGTNATIIQYKNIGDNSIVGAGAVIIKDVEENTVVVGNPGRVIKPNKEETK